MPEFLLRRARVFVCAAAACLAVCGVVVVSGALRPPEPSHPMVRLDVRAGDGDGSPADLSGLGVWWRARQEWFAAATAHIAQVEAERARVVVSRPAAHYGEPVRTGVDWDGIARCETGGNWSMTGSRFSGGLGFANTTWNGFGGREFAPLAGQATREQQIIVAERVRARYGLSGWGCRRFG